MGGKQKYKDSELTLSQGHTEATTTSKATNSENNLKAGRTDFHRESQTEGHIKKGRRGGDVIRNQTPSLTNYKWERYHKHGGAKESDPTLSTPGPGDLHWKEESP